MAAYAKSIKHPIAGMRNAWSRSVVPTPVSARKKPANTKIKNAPAYGTEKPIADVNSTYAIALRLFVFGCGWRSAAVDEDRGAVYGFELFKMQPTEKTHNEKITRVGIVLN